MTNLEEPPFHARVKCYNTREQVEDPDYKEGDEDRCEHGYFKTGAGACPQCGNPQ